MQTILKAAPRTAADFYQTVVYTEVLRLVVDRAYHKHGLEDRNRDSMTRLYREADTR